MTNFKKGDRVVCTEPVRGLTRGQTYVVEDDTIGSATIVVRNDFGHLVPCFSERFRFADLGDALSTTKVPPRLEDVVFATSSRVVDRSYDFKKGDARRYNHEAAIRLAESRTIARGCRQQLRLDGPAISGGRPLWLIQDIA